MLPLPTPFGRTSRPARPLHRTPLPLWCTCLLLLLEPAAARAWWNADWQQRTVVTLNTSSSGIPTQAPVHDLAVPVRLHSGNFDFLNARTDAADLRVLGADDSTALSFWIERYDPVSELAIVWVKVPLVQPGTDRNVLYLYAGNDKAQAIGAQSASLDGQTLAAFHFAEPDGVTAAAGGRYRASMPVEHNLNGILGPSARFSGNPLLITASAPTGPAHAAYSIGLWARPDVLGGRLLRQGAVQIALDGGAVNALLGTAQLRGGALQTGAWSQVVVTCDRQQVSLYVNGLPVIESNPAPSGCAALSDLDPIALADGYQGQLDEVEIADVARSAEWIRLNYAAQSADGRLIATSTQTRDAAAGAGQSRSYYAVLFRNLTADAWGIILILAAMLVVAIAVMLRKSVYLQRTDGANRAFLAHFQESSDVLQLPGLETHAGITHSCLYRIHCSALREFHRFVTEPGTQPLSSAAVDVLKASVDASAVREGYILSSGMVLLTIAIAGGPFLGLLGTVTGVMITFASIAANGDVNINAIAPGIAAALLATVSGLIVAIPSLFAYNYLASRIRRMSSDMRIFADELVARIALACERC